jgi:hypothetical protein
VLWGCAPPLPPIVGGVPPQQWVGMGVPEDVVNAYTTIIQYFDSFPRDKFSNLIGVNIQMLDITNFMKKATINKKPILHYYKEFFKQQKMTEVGVVLKDLICIAMKNKNDNFDFQDPHQDYFPVPISSDNNMNFNKEWLPWSAIIPVSEQGLWLNIWYDFQTPLTIEVKRGQIVFSLSDVVHCSGRPKVDMLVKKIMGGGGGGGTWAPVILLYVQVYVDMT